VRIGIDLDNTIIDYDGAFAAAALALGLLAEPLPAGKTAVRDALRRGPGGEAAWMQLQAFVYGPGIGAARLFDGVDTFIAEAARRAIPLTIVSHKSETAAAAPAGPNLRACALAFLRDRAIEVPVHFESTRAGKCRRIGTLELTHFIDDLVDVFADPLFPGGVERWLFAPHGSAADAPADRRFASWAAVFDGLDA
jgi:hypothetical protein